MKYRLHRHRGSDHINRRHPNNTSTQYSLGDSAKSILQTDGGWEGDNTNKTKNSVSVYFCQEKQINEKPQIIQALQEAIDYMNTDKPNTKVLHSILKPVHLYCENSLKPKQEITQEQQKQYETIKDVFGSMGLKL